MRIVLLKSKMVRGKQLLAGDEFECPDKEGQLWIALAWARVVDGVTAVTDETRDRNRRGVYRRRDMRAEK